MIISIFNMCIKIKLNLNSKIVRIAILTVFYKPLINDKNFIEVSKSFQGRFCFINSN